MKMKKSAVKMNSAQSLPFEVVQIPLGVFNT